MNTQVVVAGAGYAGAVAAKRLLSKNPDLQVTVVNPRSDFVERIRLHQLATGNHAAAMPLAAALPDRARLIVDSITSIDPSEQEIRLAAGDGLPYDHLVYAVGSTGGLDELDGAREYAFAIAEYESALALRQRLAALVEDTPVVVIGGGLTGIETAAEIAEQRPELAVTVVSSGPIAEGLHDRARTRIRRTLTALAVDIVEGARVTRIGERGIDLADGRTIPSECTVTAAASAVPDLARRSGLPTDEAGRLLVDDTLTCPSWPSIVGAGDAVSIEGRPLRMSCQAAVPLGAHAADTLLRRMDGRTPEKVEARFVGLAISLGRRSGVVQRTDALDNPRATVVGGRVGALIKERVCASTLNWGVNPRRPVTLTWS